MQKQKKTIDPKAVAKPYLMGKPFDSSCVKAVLGMFLATLGLMLGFLVLGGMMMWDNRLMRVGTNLVLMLGGYLLFYYNGTNRGATAVNQGEIMYQRRETGRDIDPKELDRSYHPLKGFLIGLLGCVPVILCGIVLALIAKRQMVTAGALPTWINGMNRPEVTGALTAYAQAADLTLEDVLRLIVRMSVMPAVNIVGAENADGLLLLERLSALLLAMPGVAYGIGYLQGVSIRRHVHANIAEGKRKQARKARKAQQRKKAQRNRSNGPEQLN